MSRRQSVTDVKVNVIENNDHPSRTTAQVAQSHHQFRQRDGVSRTLSHVEQKLVYSTPDLLLFAGLSADRPSASKIPSVGRVPRHEAGEPMDGDDVDDVEIIVPPKLEIEEVPVSFFWKYLGCILAFSCSLANSLCGFIAILLINTNVSDTYPKSALNDRDGYGISFCTLWRFLGVLIPSFFILVYYLWRHTPETGLFDGIWPCFCRKSSVWNSVILVIRSLLGVAGVVTGYMALEYISLGDSTTIVFSNPVFVTFFAWIFLKEKLGIVPIIVCLVTIFGVIMIAQPPFLTGSSEMESGREKGILLSCVSMLAAAFVFIMLRFLRDVHWVAVGIIFGVISAICGLIHASVEGKLVVPVKYDWLLFIAMALLTCVAQITITLALKYEEAGPVSVIRTSDVLFSFMWQSVNPNKKEIPNGWSGGGAAIVVACILIMFFRKFIMNLPPESKTRQMLNFITK